VSPRQVADLSVHLRPAPRIAALTLLEAC
jgi:hypothetical protein